MRSKKEIEKQIAIHQEEVDLYTCDGSGGQSAIDSDFFTQADSWLTALKWVLGMEREEICEEQNRRISDWDDNFYSKSKEE